MKTRYLTFLILLASLSCSEASAQLHYYGNGAQQILIPDSTLLAVFFVDSFPSELSGLTDAELNAIKLYQPQNLALFEFDSNRSSNFSVSDLGIPDSTIQSEVFGLRTSTGTIITMPLQTIYKWKNGNETASGWFIDELEFYGGVFSHTQNGYSIVRFEDPLSNLAFSNWLYETGEVIFSHPNFFESFDNLSDPLYSSQYQINGSGYDCNAPEAWNISTGSDNITVAIYDSGFTHHEDLVDGQDQSRVLPGFTLALNPGTLEPVTEDGLEFATGPHNGHGAAVAGIVSASHNETGIRGVAPEVKVLSLNKHQANQASDLADGFFYCMDTEVDVINCSWGFSGVYYDVVADAIREVIRNGRDCKGIPIVFASGNQSALVPEFDVFHPADVPGVITVGAINSNGQKVGYSCFGPAMDFVARSASSAENPDVYSLHNMGQGPVDDHYDVWAGTSFAAPVVTGVIALLLSEYPELTVDEVNLILQQSATDVGDAGWDELTGYGAIDAYAALQVAELYTNPCLGVEFDFESQVIVEANQTLTIDESTTFLHDIFVNNDGQLVIEEGAEVQFGPDVKIVVKSGGTMEVGGATLTSACAKMWRGIEVWPGGVVTVTGSIIENAHLGLVSGKPTGIGPFYGSLNQYYSKGGNIEASENEFINCGIGIAVFGNVLTLAGAHSSPAQTIYIVDNIFKGNGQLLDLGYNSNGFNYFPNCLHKPYANANSSARMAEGIRAVKIEGITCEGNTFENVETGIRSFFSRFDIIGNSFVDSRFGIHATGSGWGKGAMRIAENSFLGVHDPTPGHQPGLMSLPNIFYTGSLPGSPIGNVSYLQENSAAILCSSVGNLRIEKNVFGDEIEPSGLNHIDFQTNAIYLENCDRARVADGNLVYNYQRGVIVNDADFWGWGQSSVAKLASNQDYNSFNRVAEDVLTVHDNLFFVLRCNVSNYDFGEDDEWDVESQAFWQNAGMMNHQGFESLTSPMAGAGNEFLPTTGNEHKFIKSVSTVGGSMYEDWALLDAHQFPMDEATLQELGDAFIYYHHGNSNADNPFRPKKMNGAVHVAALNTAFSESNSCLNPWMIAPSQEHGYTKFLWDNMVATRDLIIEQQALLDSTLNALDNFHAETYDMLDAIYGGIDDYWELRSYLYQNSPLSSEVLEAMMLNYDIPAEYFADVFALNSVIETGLYALLLESISDWPEAVQEELMQLYLVNPEAQTFTSLRRRVTHATQGFNYFETEWLNSLAEEEEWEELEEYLENLSTPGGQAGLLHWRVANGDWEGVEAALDTFPDEHPDWAMARDIWQLALANVTDSTDFIISKEAADSLFRHTGPSDESFYLLKNTFEYYGFETPLLVPVPYIDLERKKPDFPFFGTKKKAKKSMLLFPNPVREDLNVLLSWNEEFEGVLEIVDMQGRVVKTEGVRFTRFLTDIDVRGLNVGEYIVVLRSNGGTVFNGSFIKP